ncbi:MAG TPA: hypothetical protein VFY66_03170, partial [Anaerolineales bacterium]|nr:hypothetical protein [Anaerolineales bacterium]
TASCITVDRNQAIGHCPVVDRAACSPALAIWLGEQYAMGSARLGIGVGLLVASIVIAVIAKLYPIAVIPDHGLILRYAAPDPIHYSL